MKFTKINYNDLNARQKEKYNYQKVSAVLADYGFITILLSDDWNGADFLAVPREGEILKIQLKGRLTFMKKYIDKGLHVCFRHEDVWYLYPHDECLKKLTSEQLMVGSSSWEQEGAYSFPQLTEALKSLLRPYQIGEI